MSRDCQVVINNKKKCSLCFQILELEKFSARHDMKSGKRSQCKTCIKVISKKYNDRPEVKAQQVLKRQENKAQIKANFKRWQAKPGNADKVRFKNKVLSNARLRVFTLKPYAQSFSALFTQGMSYDNYGTWQIDHIVPLKVWIDAGVTDLNIINAIDNLQPLWAKDNQTKSANYYD